MSHMHVDNMHLYQIHFVECLMIGHMNKIRIDYNWKIDFFQTRIVHSKRIDLNLFAVALHSSVVDNMLQLQIFSDYKSFYRS